MFFRVTWQDRHTKKLVHAINPKQTDYRRVDPYLYREEATYGPENGRDQNSPECSSQQRLSDFHSG